MKTIKCTQCGNEFRDHVKKDNGKWMDISYRKRCTVCLPLQEPKHKTQNKCLCCGKPTTNPKFCSSKCSHTINSKLRKPKAYFCNKCGACIGHGYRNCANKTLCDNCKSKRNYYNISSHWADLTLGDLKKKSKNIHQAHAKIRNWARTTYLKSDRVQRCSKCGYNKHYEVCHIRPVSWFTDSDLISEINHIDNLIALCPNCHWELDHNL